MNNSNVKKNVTMALLTAMCFVLTKYSIPLSPSLIIGFGVIPIIVCAILYGGVSAGICYSISNILRVLVSGYAISPVDIPLTLVCFLTGLLYGIFLYNKKITVVNVLIPTIITCLFLNLIVNTYLFSLLYGTGFNGFLAMLPSRIIKNVIMIPINVAIVMFISKIRPIVEHAKN